MYLCSSQHQLYLSRTPASTARLPISAAWFAACVTAALCHLPAQVRTDPLQLLHTLHNLADLLAHLAAKYNSSAGSSAAATTTAAAAAATGGPYGPGVPRTLRDDSLASEAAAIRDNYLAQRQAALAAAHAAYLKAATEALPVLQQHKQHASKPQSDEDIVGGAGGSRAAGAAAAAGGRQRSSANGTSAYQQAMMGVDGGDDDDDDSWLEQDLQEDDVAAEESEFEMTAGAAAGAGAAAAAGSAGWYVSVIDAVVEAGRADEVADLVRQKLQEGDTYRQKVAQNATSIANRFATLHGLKLLISKELGAMATQQAAAMSQLQDLQEGCTAPGGPEQGLAEQAGQCGRCRAETGVAGLVCRHCRLDEGMRWWEVRLFSLHTRALVAGTMVSGIDSYKKGLWLRALIYSIAFLQEPGVTTARVPDFGHYKKVRTQSASHSIACAAPCLAGCVWAACILSCSLTLLSPSVLQVDADEAARQSHLAVMQLHVTHLNTFCHILSPTAFLQVDAADTAVRQSHLAAMRLHVLHTHEHVLSHSSPYCFSAG
jgi:hypothetical protein